MQGLRVRVSWRKCDSKRESREVGQVQTPCGTVSRHRLSILIGIYNRKSLIDFQWGFVT